jgi:hypothetical protein
MLQRLTIGKEGLQAGARIKLLGVYLTVQPSRLTVSISFEYIDIKLKSTELLQINSIPHGIKDFDFSYFSASFFV